MILGDQLIGIGGLGVGGCEYGRWGLDLSDCLLGAPVGLGAHTSDGINIAGVPPLS